MTYVKVDVTAEDLQGDSWNVQDCPGYRSIKRVVPQTLRFIFNFFVVLDGESGQERKVEIPQHIGNAFAFYAWGLRGREPFSYIATIPDDIEVNPEYIATE